MNRFLAVSGKAGLLGVGVLVTEGCGPGLTTVSEEFNEPAIELALDTLDIEVQSLWVRVSAVPAEHEDLVLTWELEARTANPYWGPRVRRHSGRRSFETPDTARIWGNIPRAYDFTLSVLGTTVSGDLVADTLRIRAPTCPDPHRPTLLCNPRNTSGNGSRSRGSTRSARDPSGP